MMQNTLCPNLKVTIVLIFLHIIKSTKLEVPLEMEDKLLTLSTYKTRVTSTRYDVSPVGQTLPSFRELLIDYCQGIHATTTTLELPCHAKHCYGS